MSIQCSHLTKFYGQKRALSDVSAQIAEGKITGLVGPNGAGKSTLIKLLTGLVFPTTGYVSIDGFDAHNDHQKAMQHLGAIVEWPSFYPDLSARHNLAILSGGHGKKYEEKLDTVTEFLRIRNILDRKAGVLSTGMKQRLGIALALLPDSRYIILDEPANGLDPAGIVEIRQLIRDYNKEFGITVLVSSHLLGEIEVICDDILMLVDGELRAAGCLKELLTNNNQLFVVTPQLEKALLFCKKARSEKLNWISSEPELYEDGFVFQLSAGVPPEEASAALFKAGIELSHFSRKQLKLEEFFLQKTEGKNK